MHRKIFLLVFFLAVIINAQEQNSTISKLTDSEKLNAISVTIGGSFIVTGSYRAAISERADQFITRLYNEARNAALSSAREAVEIEKASSKIEKYARRNITLKRKTGEIIKVDLDKFRLTANFEFNPYLKNDDVIIFPELNIETNFIAVEGAVNFPTKFQFAEGDKLSDALLFARGINQAYENVKEAEIYRLDKTGNKEEIIKVGINDRVDLKIGDRIKVLSEEYSKKDFKVLVLGEVKNPGYIFIKKDQTTVKELIERAGGFTNTAWLENTELMRGTNSQQILRMKFIKEQFEKNPEYRASKFETKFNSQNMEMLLMARSSDITVEDSVAFSVDNILRLYYSPGVVDFTKINDTSSKEGKFIVKDGDVVLVPEKQNLVYMFGQVKNPGYVPFEAGKDYNYYINAVGGKGEAAEGDVKIIKAKGRIWVTAGKESVIEPGDFIYLPKSVSHRWEYYLMHVGSIASIVTAISSFVYFLFIAK